MRGAEEPRPVFLDLTWWRSDGKGQMMMEKEVTNNNISDTDISKICYPKEKVEELQPPSHTVNEGLSN